MERNGLWRFLLLTGGMIGFVQAVALPFLPESPASLAAAGKLEQARRELAKIRGTPDVEEELAGYMGQSGGQSDTTDDTQTVSGQDPVLAAEAGQSGRTGNTNLGNENTPLLQATSTPGADNEIGLVAFATKREHRLGLMIVAGVMLAQQLTGINAVVFYGVSILQVLLPNSARYLNAGISGVNLFVTLGASLLFDRVSHKILLLASMLFMAISAGLLAISIFAGLATLSAIATLLFVVSFSMGLGPLPWMVASRRIEPVAVGAAQSIALISNWMGTFFVSFLVPMLAHSAGMYAIFIVFTALSLIFLVWGIFFL
ncbi:MFS general substrate transporter [Tuber magnatum]|uniref:MFS general substrate transporter n=1 Tax=Tuber magnatum TaxID=42249 RepID=A0A317T037_9PEZI|nr:MFS general substrate transporter [Tuber magnatum]